MSQPPEENFFSRWSRRKAQGGVAQEPPPVVPTVTPSLTPSALQAEAEAEPAAAPPAPLPTMEDVNLLTQASDYSPFVKPGVDESVKQAALKKLFTDPHFNVMDGLDIYIDDYSKPDPMPASMLAKLTQSAFLGFFPEPTETAVAGPAEPALSSEPPPLNPPPEALPHEDPAVRLQPDAAAEPRGADQGPGPASG
jgi:Protein of unknown function (DUF3306)